VRKHHQRAAAGHATYTLLGQMPVVFQVFCAEDKKDLVRLGSRVVFFCIMSIVEIQAISKALVASNDIVGPILALGTGVAIFCQTVAGKVVEGKEWTVAVQLALAVPVRVPITIVGAGRSDTFQRIPNNKQVKASILKAVVHVIVELIGREDWKQVSGYVIRRESPDLSGSPALL
jgi:hypothetical protein